MKKSKYQANIGSMKTIAKEIANIIKHLAKCQRSVSHTRKVVEPKNLGPLDGVPSFHLFLQDKLGLSHD
jgi:hypothetical protein